MRLVPGSVSKLESALRAVFSILLDETARERARIVIAANEINFEVSVSDLFSVMRQLKDEPIFSFNALIDVTVVDYLHVKTAPRFAVVYHLLSLTHNHRLRVRAYLKDDANLSAPSVTPLWQSANWMEREAFDMFGVVFEGHPDLRRILTDYGFQGHPLRKDFPVMGEREKYYDEEKREWAFLPVTETPRENIRHLTYLRRDPTVPPKKSSDIGIK